MGKTLSEDNHTADFTVCCETKEFRVHKAVFCARYRIISQNIQISDCLFRSPVFRATILSDMEEAKKGEIFIPEIDEKTLSSVIYTGQLEMSEDQNIQQMIYAVDKYDLSGFMSLFCSNMREETITGETVADLLMSSHRHEKGELRDVGMEKIRAKRASLAYCI